MYEWGTSSIFISKCLNDLVYHACVYEKKLRSVKHLICQIIKRVRSTLTLNNFFFDSKTGRNIHIFGMCFKEVLKTKNEEFYETTFICVWLTVCQLFDFKIDPSFEFWKMQLILCFDT